MNGEMMIAGAILVFAGIYEDRPLGKWVFVAGFVTFFIAVGA